MSFYICIVSLYFLNVCFKKKKRVKKGCKEAWDPKSHDKYS